MDNLTHTLIGLIAGESVGRATRAREPGLNDAGLLSRILTLELALREADAVVEE